MDTSRYGSELSERAEEQIAALRREVARLSDILSRRSGHLFEEAADGAAAFYEQARRGSARAVRAAGRQASAATGLARDNPVASIVLAVGIGLLAIALFARREDYR